MAEQPSRGTADLGVFKQEHLVAPEAKKQNCEGQQALGAAGTAQNIRTGARLCTAHGRAGEVGSHIGL